MSETETELTKQINIRLPEEVYTDFKRYCNRKGISMSNFIKSGIINTLESREVMVKHFKTEFERVARRQDLIEYNLEIMRVNQDCARVLYEQEREKNNNKMCV